MASNKRFGLRLTLGGAPNTFHTIPGLPGHYHPSIPQPVGGEGELGLSFARKLDKGSEEVELVELSEREAGEATKAHTEQAALARGALREARRLATTAKSAELVADERDALKKEAK